MSGFIALAAALLLGALVWSLWPLLRRGARPDGTSELDATRDFLVRQEAEVARDLAEGTVTEADAAALRDDIARRMLRAVEAEQRGARAGDTLRFGTVAALAALVPLGTIVVYLAVGTPSAIGNGAAAPGAANPGTANPGTANPGTANPGTVSAAEADGGHSQADLERMVGQLNDRLRANPADLDGRVLLGRTLASLRRWTEAKAAFALALQQAPDEPALHAQLGEVMTLEADDTVTDAAAGEFGKAPDDPRSRYYLAVREAQQGRADVARARLRTLAADAPPDAAWRQIVVERLRDLGDTDAVSATAAPSIGPPVASGGAAPGPTQQDMQAAASMSAEDRQSMIETMVGRLAAKLAADPSDSAGWDRLARAYDVLGKPDKAEAARHHQVVADAPAGTVAASAPAAPAPPTASPTSAPSTAAASDAVYLTKARALRAAGNEAGALEALRQGTEAMPTDLDLLLAYADGLAAGIKGDHLPASFVTVMRRINAIDPDQSDALWYLGLAAAANGDSHRASSYWRHLLDRLPADSDERRKVKKRLEALP